MKPMEETHPSLCKEFDHSASGNKYYRNIGSCLTSEAIPFERDGKPNVIDDAFGYRIPYVLCEDVQKHTIDKAILRQKLIAKCETSGSLIVHNIIDLLIYLELEDTTSCIGKE